MGTVGWHRCTKCGDRHHFQGNVIVEEPWISTCEDKQREVVKNLSKKVTKLLHDFDADTDYMRQLLADTIVLVKSDSPYTRGK